MFATYWITVPDFMNYSTSKLLYSSILVNLMAKIIVQNEHEKRHVPCPSHDELELYTQIIDTIQVTRFNNQTYMRWPIKSVQEKKNLHFDHL
jgi:hypothetical protein